MSDHCFHKQEQLYPPKGFSFQIKDREFLIDSKGGWCGQVDRVIKLQKANDIFVSWDDARDQCWPHWCKMRTELAVQACANKKSGKMFKIVDGECVEADAAGTPDAPPRAAKRITKSKVVAPKKSGGCARGCGGGKVR
jgi:hypothetical protein